MSPPTPDDVLLLAMMTRGDVIVPENERQYQYEVTQNHNVMLHSVTKPLMFVLCHDEPDVVEALNFAIKHELPISVRSGGHGVDGSSCRDGSFVIDLSRIRHVNYDAETEMVTFGPGARLADINVALLRVGRMTPVGIAPPTGAGGLVLHGGTGFLACKYGASVDNITAVWLLTANGTVHSLNMDSTGDDKELFFAVRGAASIVGIVTEITMRTYPMEMVTGGLWFMKDDENYTNTTKLIYKAVEVVQQQEQSGTRTLTGAIFMGNFPPLPHIPEELHHQPASLVSVAAFGTDEATAQLVGQFVDRPIAFGKPPTVMPFNVFNQIYTALFLAPPPFAPYFKAAWSNRPPDQDRTQEFCDLWATEKQPYMNMSLVGFEFHGGKQGQAHAAQINLGNEPCAHKVGQYTFLHDTLMYCPPEPAMAETCKMLSRKLIAIFDGVTDSDYVNHRNDVMDEADAANVMAKAYTGLDRIKAIKAKVDPNNLFHRSVNQL